VDEKFAEGFVTEAQIEETCISCHSRGACLHMASPENNRIYGQGRN
jgi:hypothetical protein